MSTRKWLICVGVVALICMSLLLSACGSSSNSGGSSSTISPTSSTGGTSTTISPTSSSSTISPTSSTAESSSTSTSVAKNINIAGVFQNTSDPFWATLGAGAVEEGKQLGVTVTLYATPTFDDAALAAAFNAALTAKPDGMFCDISVANQFITQYQQLMARGAPVVVSAGTTPAAQYQIVWTEPTSASSAFLPDVLKLIPDVKGSMAVLGGVPGLVPVEERYLPLVKAIVDARSGLTALSTEYSTFDTNKAAQYVTSTLLSHPDLKVIVAADGPDAVGVVNAIKAAGKAGQVVVIALDAVPPEVDALRSGVITALLAQPARQIGAAQVKALVDYLSGGKQGPVPAGGTSVGLPQILLTKANVDDPANAQYFYQP